jgi:hypothetical protein
MLIFFLALTLGFAFELGKGALKISSRQYDLNTTIDTVKYSSLGFDPNDSLKFKIKDEVQNTRRN